MTLVIIAKSSNKIKDRRKLYTRLTQRHTNGKILSDQILQWVKWLT